MEMTAPINMYGEYVERGASWVSIAEQCYRMQELRRYYAKKEEEYKKILVRISYETPSQGGDFLLKRIDRTGSIQYKKIPAIQHMTPQELDAYRSNATVCWKLDKK